MHVLSMTQQGAKKTGLFRPDQTRSKLLHEKRHLACDPLQNMKHIKSHFSLKRNLSAVSVFENGVCTCSHVWWRPEGGFFWDSEPGKTMFPLTPLVLASLTVCPFALCEIFTLILTHFTPCYSLFERVDGVKLELAQTHAFPTSKLSSGTLSQS